MDTRRGRVRLELAQLGPVEQRGGTTSLGVNGEWCQRFGQGRNRG